MGGEEGGLLGENGNNCTLTTIKIFKKKAFMNGGSGF